MTSTGMSVWRNTMSFLQRQSSQDLQQGRLQQVDGGFFEKFGSLFREQAEFAQTQDQIERERVALAAAEAAPKKEEEETCAAPETEKKTEDGVEGDETSLASSDSDSEVAPEKDDAAELIAAAFNIDELYCEILFEILHNVGCDISYEVGQTALFSYAQDAFKIPNDKHRYLLELAEKKEAPDRMINVEVIEAKDLRPKDSNGMSDPFVTLYLSSNMSHRYNTSVKTMTLNPVWEEHFALPITENTADENLCLEVWDFDPAESVKEKLGKIFDVKGVKGMRKLVKEIAVTATTGQHENELIGRAKIPLSTIPASGMTMWYSLDKKNKINRQGVLKVRVTFSSEKNNQVAEQEYRHLLRIVAVNWWCGTFTPQGEQLLTQHIAQSGLTPTEVALCQYYVYSSIHQSHALNLALFSNLLDKLVKPLQVGGVSEEDTKLFWDATKKLLPSCFSIIRRIRKKSLTEKAMVKQDERTVPTVLNDAVAQGANDWLNHILENNNNKPDSSNVGKLQNMIQIIQLVRSDLQKAIEFYDKFFQEIVNFQFAKALYVFYQARICILCEPDVIEICKNLRSLRYSSYNDLTKEEGSPDPLAEGTSLFELYLALQRIEKAVELDKLVHVDSNVKYSSSAVDTLTIFYQVKVFWEQLNWPDVESCYTFIAKIIDDICRCCVFYADKMSARVEGMGDTQDDKKFEVTPEWCLAINNIDYVRETLEPFTRDLGMDGVIHKIGEMKSPVEAQRCQHTLDNVIANAIDTGAELGDQDSNSCDRLMMYVDNNLSTLHRELNEENFSRTLEVVWDMLNGTLGEIIQSNIEVHLELANEFKKVKDSQLGEISVRTKFEENILTIEVMNARNLLPMDSNGTCDAFVRLHLLPEDKFSNVEKPKTKTHNRTQFPLFDETFVFVKDKDLLGYNNQYIGEAYISFKDIEDTSQSTSVLPQIHLQLARPTEKNSIKALEYRQGDKQAKEFLRKLKQRMGS
ncbi:unnamed protein product [Callosobruchus maculatus]|uniref:C2 domain-containing protein n=1 Tax=Callosobruchus maculatus TaxID=64391 RepID=A0A653BEB2_CALMS|nr:unnamed protein product [Callosobruchus maculatus]